MILVDQQISFLIVMLMIPFALPLRFEEKIGWVNTFTWVWFLTIMSAYVFWPNFRMEVYSKIAPYYNKVLGAQNLILLLTLPTAILAIQKPNKKIISYVFDVLLVGFFFNLIYIVLRMKLGDKTPKGLLDAHTFDTGIASLLIFYMATHVKEWVRYLTPAYVSMILFVGGDTAIANILIGSAAFIFSHFQIYRKPVKLLMLAVGFVATVFSVAHFRPALLKSSGRFDIWHLFIDPMLDDTKLFLLGHGPGSFELRGLAVKIENIRYVLMHNDYLQLAFEYGFASLLVFLAFMVYNLFGLKRYPVLFATACMFCFTMFTYFPMHFFHSLLIGLILIRANVQRRSAWVKELF